MKIRNGFVSNSSSSSFVFIVDVEAHEKALAQVEDVDDILKRIFANPTKRKFCNRDVIIISGGDYDGYNVKGDLSNEDIEQHEHEEDYYEYWGNVVCNLWKDYTRCILENDYIEKWENH